MADRAEAERLLSGIDLGAQSVVFDGETTRQGTGVGAGGCNAFTVLSRSGASIWQEINKLARAKNWTLRELSDKPLTLEETFLMVTEPKRAKKGESAA